MNKFLVTVLILIFLSPHALASEETAKHNLTIAFPGFFNSESREFNPVPIGYMVDYEEAHKTLKKELAKQNYTVNGYEVFSNVLNKELKDEEVTIMKDFLHKALSETNEYLKANWNDLEVDTLDKKTCSKLKIPDLTKFESYSNWLNTDRIYIIIGLEAQAPVGHGLRSGLIALSFNPMGICKEAAAIPYDFSKFDTKEMIKDSRALISNLQSQK